MKASEAAALLSYASALDGREVGEVTARAWADVILPNVLFEDAMQCLKDHYANSKWPIMPSDINDRSRAIRKQRVDYVTREFPPLAPPESVGDDSTATTIEWLRFYWEAVGDGHHPLDADRIACQKLDLAPRNQLEFQDGNEYRVQQFIERTSQTTRLPRRE